MSIYSSLGGKKPYWKKSMGTTLIAGLVGLILGIAEIIEELLSGKR